MNNLDDHFVLPWHQFLTWDLGLEILEPIELVNGRDTESKEKTFYLDYGRG